MQSDGQHKLVDFILLLLMKSEHVSDLGIYGHTNVVEYQL